MARAALGLTLTRLAGRSGLNVATLSRFETGQTPLPPKTKELLRTILTGAGVRFTTYGVEPPAASPGRGASGGIG